MIYIRLFFLPPSPLIYCYGNIRRISRTYVLINCKPGLEYQVIVERLKSLAEVVEDDDVSKVYRSYDIIAKVS